MERGDSPFVSVIVLNWNGQKYLGDCLSSLLEQTYFDMEIILVDNASTDGSVEFVREKYPNVKVIVNEKNLGFCEGNNIGIRLARGGYIALLNTDTRVDRNWISELVRIMKSDDRVGICASKERDFYDPKVIASAGVIMPRDFNPINRGLGEPDGFRYNKSEEVFGPHGSSAFFRREMLDEIGLFDEDFFMSQEETDLAWRARLRGWKCVYVPMAVVYHIGSGSTRLLKGGRRIVLYHSERNRMYMTIKNIGVSTLILNMPYLIIYEIISLLLCFVQLDFTRIRARIDTVKNLRIFLHKRKEIQKMRTASERDLRGLFVTPDYMPYLRNAKSFVKRIFGLNGKKER